MTTAPFVAVIGESHVRTFATNDNYAPFFIGPGLTTGFVTDEIARSTADRCKALIEALPPNMPLLFTMTEPDIRLHLENRYGTQDRHTDAEQLVLQVGRYKHFLQEVIGKFRSPDRIAVWHSIPSANREHTVLAKTYNSLLEVMCASLGVHFIEIWDFLISGDALDKNASTDGIHLSQQFNPTVTPRLKMIGWIPDRAPEAQNYGWRYRYSETLKSGVKVRIWGEELMRGVSPAAQNVAAADAALASLGTSSVKGRRVRVYNGAEGYVAAKVSRMGAKQVATFDESHSSRQFARLISEVFSSDINVLECEAAFRTWPSDIEILCLPTTPQILIARWLRSDGMEPYETIPIMPYLMVGGLNIFQHALMMLRWHMFPLRSRILAVFSRLKS